MYKRMYKYTGGIVQKYYIVNSFENKSDLFLAVSDKLQSEKMVTDGFLKAITKREEQYPTGLKTEQFVENGFNAAIPHVDCQYCIEDALVFVFTKDAVKWRDMVYKKELYVNFFIFIISASGSAHMLILPKVIEILKDIEFQTKLKQVENAEQLQKLIDVKTGGNNED